MTRIEVPSETLLVEMGEDGLNIVETFMKMSEVSGHMIDLSKIKKMVLIKGNGTPKESRARKVIYFQ